MTKIANTSHNCSYCSNADIRIYVCTCSEVIATAITAANNKSNIRNYDAIKAWRAKKSTKNFQKLFKAKTIQQAEQTTTTQSSVRQRRVFPQAVAALSQQKTTHSCEAYCGSTCDSNDATNATLIYTRTPRQLRSTIKMAAVADSLYDLIVSSSLYVYLCVRVHVYHLSST